LAIYVSQIANKVESSWLKPPTAPKSLSCKVHVNQLPNGEVVGVQVVKSCGDEATDRSVEQAVRKASPLPIPPDARLFDRELEFTFEPKE